METLKKFWHWADNELPCRGYEGRDLFDKKATNGGPLSEEAQEAMQQAVEVVGLRAPDILHPSGEVLRPAIKLLSFAILEAWQLLVNDERIQQAMREQAAKQAEHINGVRPVKPVTVIPVIGEMGVTRSTEHEELTARLVKIMAGTNQYLSVRVDSRGILFSSREFPEIVDSVNPYDLQIGAGNGGIDEHMLFRITNTLRLRVIERKKKAQSAVRAFPDAQNMFTGEPEGDYAKCEYECARILNMLGAADVCVTVDKKDGRVMFYHRIYTGVTYTLNYAPTVSSNSVEAAVSTVRKGALAQERQTNAFAVRLTGDWDKGNVG